MSNYTTKIREALERYRKMKWPQTTDGAPCRDELIAQDALAALAELERQPSPTILSNHPMTREQVANRIREEDKDMPQTAAYFEASVRDALKVIPALSPDK